MENDHKRIVKYRTQIRKCCINILAWQENNPNPNDEEAKHLDVLVGRLKDAKESYRENIRQGNWDKHTFISPPLNETKLKEQQEFIDTHQFVEGSGN